MGDPKRAARYERIYVQLEDLIEGKSPSLTAAMATICAVLQAKMSHHSWTGFCFVASNNELHVGPYQGPVACQVLRDRGVCLHCVRTQQPVVVPENVEVNIDGSSVKVKGPKGELAWSFNPELSVEMDDGEVVVTRPTDQRHHR